MNRTRARLLFPFFILLQACLLPPSSKQMKVDPVPPVQFDVDAAASRLARALTFKTVSYGEPENFNPEPLRAFHGFLEKSFPKVHAALKRETISDYSLLYEWEGSDPALKPAVLMAHMDVVPAQAAEWARDPFGGQIEDGYVWGRGAIDDKGSLMSILEATELLLAEGYRPRRTIYFSFGHDEEIGGTNGAQKAAPLLASRGVHPEFVLDEGFVVVDGVVPGMKEPVALVGVAEKGYVSLELSVKAAGGHSSQPPGQTAIGILSAGLARLEARPMPASLKGPAREMFRYLAPHMPFAEQFVFDNLWLTSGLVKAQLEKSPATNATLRTTTAVTMIAGGVKDNVLPTEARAVVNFRIHPNDTSKKIVEHVRRAVNDERIAIGVYQQEPREASKVSPTGSEGFKTIQKTIGQIFPGAIVAPSLVIGGTDSRDFEIVTDNIYRFEPIRLGSKDIQTIHGKDERLSVENYAGAVRFYRQLLKNAGQ